MKISIQSFKGVSPKTNPRYLDNGGAQIALNVEAFGQSVKPMNGLSASLLTLAKSGVLQTLYRFGQDYAGEDKYWFHWPAVVDVCRSQIAGDVSEWTFYTGDGYPKATYNALALSGTSTAYPVISRRLGLPAPTTALTATVTNPVAETSPAELTLTEYALAQMTTTYGLKVFLSIDDGATWAETAVSLPAPPAPSVTLSSAQVADVTPAYGVYVSLDNGLTKTHCPITGQTTATAPQITLTSAHLSSITTYTSILISVDGGSTYLAGSLGDIDYTPAAYDYAALINQFAGSVVTATVSGTSVVVKGLTTGAASTLRISFGSTTLIAAGTDGTGITNAAANIVTAINNAAWSLVTASVGLDAYGAATVIVTANSSGSTVKLRVWWGTSSAQALSATGTPLTPALVVQALSGANTLTATEDGANVVVTTVATGENVSLKIQWGDETGRTLTAKGSTADLGTKETRVYTYTFISDEADLIIESAPWSAEDMGSATVDVYPGPGKEMCLLSGSYREGYDATTCAAAGGVWEKSQPVVTLTGFGTPPSGEGWYHTGLRIYRATAGVFLYVDETGTPLASYRDTKAADELGEACPSIIWSPPPADLQGLINLPNGMVAGFTGRDVYFCPPYRPYAYPVDYMQSVDYPVVGLGRVDTTLVVLTKGTPYLMQGSSPEYIRVVKSDIEQACVSKRSIVSMGGAVLYASPDGLMRLSSGGSDNLTASIFDREDWQALNPGTIHAYGHDNRYIAFHDAATVDGVTYYGFVLDLKSGQFCQHNISGVTAGYSDLRNDQLYLINANRQVVKWDGGSPLTGRWKSKIFSLPQISGFTCAQVEAEGYTGLKCALYRDATKVKTELTAASDALLPSTPPRIEGRYPFRLEALQGRDWEVDLTVTQEVFNVVIAQSMAEIGTA